MAAKILIEQANKDGSHTAVGNAHDSTTKAKAALRDQEPGDYRIVQLKWQGKVAPADSTIIRKKG